jgi:uncharacterized protein YmfQ (DUF2313 family)
MADRHIRRTAADYAVALRSLIPQGIAWPTSPTSVLSKVINGITGIFGYADDRAADLLETETDPRKTSELLDEWESAFGLPDLCIPLPPTDEPTRRINLVDKMTLLGAQSRSFFIGRGKLIGETIAIREYAPYMCGVSRCGDTRSPLYGDDVANFRWQLGPPENRFFWTVKIAALLPSFKGADISCLLRRWKPAHTDIVMDYSVVGDNMLDFSEPIWDSIYIGVL